MNRFFIFLATALLCSACSPGAQKSAQDVASAAPGQAQDALLAASIKTKIAAIDLDSAAAVKVDVEKGAVTLTGKAKSANERSQFESAARSVNGVTGVTDNLGIDPKLRGARESLNDAALVTRVMGALAAQTGINAFNIKGSAHDGVVTLNGSVKTQATKTQMLDAARATNGVRSVVDQITVR